MSAQALDRLIMDEFRAIKEVTTTVTTVALSCVKDEVRIPLDENETNEKGKRGARRKSRSGWPRDWRELQAPARHSVWPVIENDI